MKKVLLCIIMAMCGMVITGASNSTCTYSEKKVADELAQFDNIYGWKAHCNAKYVGQYYAKYGFIKKDVELLAEKYNRVQEAGQKVVTADELGGGLVYLYELFAGMHTDAFISKLTGDILNGFFGQANGHGLLNQFVPPQWYTDKGLYGKNETIANELRSFTEKGMEAGARVMLEGMRESFPKYCKPYDPEYAVAFQDYCDYLDLKYKVCEWIIAN